MFIVNSNRISTNKEIKPSQLLLRPDQHQSVLVDEECIPNMERQVVINDRCFNNNVSVFNRLGPNSKTHSEVVGKPEEN